MRGVSFKGAFPCLLCVLCSCAVGPDYHRPSAPRGDHYGPGTDPSATSSAWGAEQRFEAGAEVDARWWRAFGSPAMDAIIDEAMAHNPGTGAAEARLRQSQDNLRGGYGLFLPRVDGTFDGTRQRVSPSRFGESGPSSVFNLFTLSATVSYTLDLFGGERRAVEGLAAQAEASRQLERGAELILSANVANAVIARAAYEGEASATEKIIEAEKEQVRLAEAQAKAGTVPYADVLSLKAQLSSAEATLPALRQRAVEADDLLATLAGHAPSEWRAPEIGIEGLSMPGTIPVSLPSELVDKRPDILVAEASLHAASAAVGVATAAMLPSVTLGGGYGASATHSNDLFSAASNVWNVTGGITAPLFAGGTLWYGRKAAVEGYNEAAASYRQTVLAAFAQVSDLLRALEHDAEALRAQDEAVADAAEALRLAEANYTSGLTSVSEVLIANTQYGQAQIADLQLRAVRFQDTVGLFAALGGGLN